MGQIPGVRGVSNLILIRSHLPTIDPVRIKEAIESALERQADRDAERIEVSIDQSTVVLTGDVQSWADRCTVVGATEHTPGVTSVTDHLHLKSPS
jgi:osmotically-inducible protein OsmY